MSIKRLLPNGVELVCMCGAPTVFAQADLVVGLGIIQVPCCPQCKTRRVDLFVQNGDLTAFAEETRERLRAVKTVFKWLVDGGRLVDGLTVEQVPDAMLVGAAAWPTGAPVEVALAAPFARVHAEWLRAHPQ
jgi:hypothetical protein